MDGCADGALDNIFIERLWRSPKTKTGHLSLGEIAGWLQGRRGIKGWMALYNNQGPQFGHMNRSQPRRGILESALE